MSIGSIIGIGLYLLPYISYWNIGLILYRCTLDSYIATKDILIVKKLSSRQIATVYCVNRSTSLNCNSYNIVSACVTVSLFTWSQAYS